MEPRVKNADREASAGKKSFEPPRLQRVGTLKELTKAFAGAGTDTFIVGMSHN